VTLGGKFAGVGARAEVAAVQPGDRAEEADGGDNLDLKRPAVVPRFRSDARARSPLWLDVSPPCLQRWSSTERERIWVMR